MKELVRLTTVVDCGTINGIRKVLMEYQLKDRDYVVPKSESTQPYKPFIKGSYGGLSAVNLLGNNLANSLGIEGDITIEKLCDAAGKELYVEVGTDDKGKEVVVDYLGSYKLLSTNYGLDVIIFRLPSSIEEIEEFDKQHPYKTKFLKTSKEYTDMKNISYDESSIGDMF